MGASKSNDTFNRAVTEIMNSRPALPSMVQHVTITEHGFIITQQYINTHKIQRDVTRALDQQIAHALSRQCPHIWMAGRSECRDCYTQRRLGCSWADLAWRKKIARLRPQVLAHERDVARLDEARAHTHITHRICNRISS
jgi:hypothetical protein